jgi:hypothetical protein
VGERDRLSNSLEQANSRAEAAEGVCEEAEEQCALLGQEVERLKVKLDTQEIKASQSRADHASMQAARELQIEETQAAKTQVR